MKVENLTKLAVLLNKAICMRLRNESPGLEIWIHQYQDEYFDIFFEELKLNKKPLPYDQFSSALGSKLENDVNADVIKDVMGTFISYWDAWVALYREMDRRGMLGQQD